MKKMKLTQRIIPTVTALIFAASPIYTYASIVPQDIINLKNELFSGGSQNIFNIMELKRNYIVISSEMEAVTIETVSPVETVAPTTTTTPDVTTVPSETSSDVVTTDITSEYAYSSTIMDNVEHLYKGIDVSKYQGNIDWEKAKDSGLVEFAILRAGHGTKDVKFESYYQSCKEYDIPVGAYWYCTAATTDEAIEEAELLLDILKGKQFEFPIYIDIEDPVQQELSRQEITNLAITFCETIQNEGYYVGIYSSLNWFETVFYTDQLSDYDKWLAQWRVSEPKYGNSFGGMWQYGCVGTTEQYLSGDALMIGAIPGIDVPCDTDLCYRDYPAIIKEAGLNGF